MSRLEYRTGPAPSSPSESLRAGGGKGWALTGHAAVFDVETTIGGMFRELVEPGAFKRAIRESDTFALLNHDPNRVLGRRSARTLALTEDERGLAYIVALNPDDPEHASLRAKVARGDVTQSSFAFTVRRERWERGGGGRLPLRRIVEVGLLADVSPVTFPAYPEADGVSVG